MKNILIQVALFCCSVFVAYSIYQEVMLPIQFDKVKEQRYEVVVKSLKDIRKAQLAYKDRNGKFTGSLDTLVNFIQNDSLAFVFKSGTLTDDMIERGLTEAKALKEGLIVRDTTLVPAKDSLFGKTFDARVLRKIPGTNAEFVLGAGEFQTASGVVVQIFEAKAHNRVIFADLKDGEYEQQIINANEASRINSKYPGLKVGSLTEPNNNAGNWE